MAKESKKFKLQLYMALKENEPNMAAMNLAKEIKQKAKLACQKYMKNTWREK